MLMSEEKLERLRKILFSTFPNSPIPQEIINLKMGDLEEWDSLGNFSLLLSVEQSFNLEFSLEDLTKISSIAELIKKLENY